MKRANDCQINELGLFNETIFTSRLSAAASHRYLYYPDHLARMPHPLLGWKNNIQTLATEPIFKGFAKSLWIDFLRGPRNEDIVDQSISAFFARRMTPQLTDNLISGIIHGIYAGDVDRLSARSIFPRQWHYDGTGMGILWGSMASMVDGPIMKPSEAAFIQEMAGYEGLDPDLRTHMKSCSVFTFRNGLGSLTNALAQHLREDPAVDIRTSCKADKLSTSTQYQGVEVMQGKSSEIYDHVVSTLSASHLSDLCPAISPLPSIPTVNVMTVNLFYSKTQALPPGPGPDQLGFGYLIPRSVPFEQNPERALGVVFDHAYAPLGGSADQPTPNITQDELPSGGTKLTVMLGGHWWDGWPAYPDEEEGLAMARSLVRRHLGITDEPELWRVNMQRDCIPQYTVGHQERLQKIHDILQEGFQGRLRVAGNWMEGVGVNDCLRSAWDVCVSLMDGKSTTTGLENVGRERYVQVKTTTA